MKTITDLNENTLNFLTNSPEANAKKAKGTNFGQTNENSSQMEKVYDLIGNICKSIKIIMYINMQLAAIKHY